MATDSYPKTTLEDENSEFKGTDFLGITLGKNPPRITFRLKNGQNFIFPQYEFVSARLEPDPTKGLIFIEFRKYLVALYGSKLDHLARAISLDEVFAIEEIIPTHASNAACYVTEIQVVETPPQSDDEHEEN